MIGQDPKCFPRVRDLMRVIVQNTWGLEGTAGAAWSGNQQDSKERFDMLQFNLRPKERDLLVEILQEYWSVLREEIGGTDNFDYRQELKEKEKSLQEILETLNQAQPS